MPITTPIEDAQEGLFLHDSEQVYGVMRGCRVVVYRVPTMLLRDVADDTMTVSALLPRMVLFVRVLIPKTGVRPVAFEIQVSQVRQNRPFSGCDGEALVGPQFTLGGGYWR